MSFLKNIDARSLFIGLLLMLALFLAAALGDAKKKMTVLEREISEIDEVAAAETFSYPTHFQQEEMASRAIEERVQNLLDDIIGRDRSHVRVRASMTLDGIISHLSMALTIDKTKVIIDPEGKYVEVDRSVEEINQLAQLAQEAAGLDKARGDLVTVFAMRFDKTQHIQAREEAVANERKNIWINIAKIVAILAAAFALRWAIQKKTWTGGFLARPESKTALLLAAGLFLCLCALGFGGARLSLRELGAFPGLFFLLLGLQRVWHVFGAATSEQQPAETQATNGGDG